MATNEPLLSPEAREAAHAVKNAQQAIEMAREEQLAQAVVATKHVLIDALKEVFGESDTENPQEMKVLVRRIPILCTNIANMHRRIEEMADNQKWVTRAIIGGVIAAVFALIMK